MEQVEYTINGIKGGASSLIHKGADRTAADRVFRESLLQHDKFDCIQKLDSAGNDFRQDTTKPRPAKPAPQPAPKSASPLVPKP